MGSVRVHRRGWGRTLVACSALVVLIAAFSGSWSTSSAAFQQNEPKAARLLATALPLATDLPDHEVRYERVDVDASGQTNEKGKKVGEYEVCPGSSKGLRPRVSVARQFLSPSGAGLPNVFVNLYRYKNAAKAFRRIIVTYSCTAPRNLGTTKVGEIEYELDLTHLSSEPLTSRGDDARAFEWTRHFEPDDGLGFDLSSRYYVFRVGPYIGIMEFSYTERSKASPLDADGLVELTVDRLADLG